MSIEFACPGCQQTLRVPQTAAGKVAKCPSCSTIVTVPDGAAGSGLNSLGTVGLNATSGGSAGTHGNSFAASEKPDAVRNPFADNTSGDAYGGEPIQPFQVGGVSFNPYASPSAFDSRWQRRFRDGTVGNQQITVSAIFNQSLALWQQHLGILIGVTLVLLAVQAGIYVVNKHLLVEMIGSVGWNVYQAASMGFRFGAFLVTTFLTIGQMQLCLKMCRREPFQFTDLFQGGSRFMPVLLASLLVAIPFEVLSYVARISIGGILSLNLYDAIVATSWLVGIASLVFNLLFWPYYYLVVDEKASVLESFGMAFRVTEGNRATSFLMWLCEILIALIGILACGIGLVAAIPLLLMMHAVAYLMMSGQMPPEGYPREQRL